jgi:hypothetical protein
MEPMNSAEAVEAKRRVLIDALMLCLGRSRVCQVLDAPTVRNVLNSAARELWREGEFRLEPVWKLLVAQPGVTAADVAPPLLAFKANEQALEVTVRVPQAISSIPKSEQERLRSSLEVPAAELAKAIAEVKAVAAAEREAHAAVGDAQAAGGEPESAARKTGKAAARRRSGGWVISVLLAAAIGIGAGLWFGFRDNVQPFDTSDVTPLLHLDNGRAVGASLSAVINDPRWATLSKSDKEKLAGQVFELANRRGIKAMTLNDASGRIQVIAAERPDGRVVVIP